VLPAWWAAPSPPAARRSARRQRPPAALPQVGTPVRSLGAPCLAQDNMAGAAVRVWGRPLFTYLMIGVLAVYWLVWWAAAHTAGLPLLLRLQPTGCRARTCTR
jgi:hypothetical protein